jgi:redox-sensitive bicupin YhaK (pirin superfamily)
MRTIELVIKPKEKDLGDNFTVRRSLPDARKRMVGPFISWDHMGPATLEGEQEMKVRGHPHIGISTLTYLFSGEILHRDSLGNEQLIRPREVNWMTAGKGITHSERSFAKDPAEQLEGIQLWIALPKDHEEVDPNFTHFKEAKLPLIESEGNQMRLIAGEFQGENSPVPVYSDLFYLNGKIKEGTKYSFKAGPKHEIALYVTHGSLEVEDEVYESFSLVIFRQGSIVSFKASCDAEYMLFGGEPFPEKRHIYWNFVSSDPEKIEQAKRDWTEGKFDKIPKETEFIPLPED